MTKKNFKIFQKKKIEPKITVDLTINCDGNQFRAHKVVIAAVSEVIEREAWMSDEITLNGIQPNIMEKLIDYCYTQMLGPFASKKEVKI